MKPTIHDMEFGVQLAQIRASENITQRQVAEFLGHTTSQLISNWERGLSRPTTKDIKKLLSFFQLDINTYIAMVALRELNKIIENGPEEKDVNKFKEAEKLDYKEKIKQNNYWMSTLTRAYTNGTSAEEILQVEQKIEAVSAKDIQAVAKKYLTKDKVVAMLMPEE
jgi:transcriptional regulator with XRE-family HTH domain